MVSLARQCSHTDWQVFNMSLPLRAHLEKLDSIPFLTVDGHLQRMVFRHTDQPVDAVNTLEFGVGVSGLVLLLTNLQDCFRLLLFSGVSHGERVLILCRIAAVKVTVRQL